MRRILAISIVWFVAVTMSAQKYGNEWIDHSLQYFKFPVYKEGIYRIDSPALAGSMNLQGINPKNFRLFIKGKEQLLYINGENDNQFNTGDYIEFYANAEMGDIDSLIYHQVNYVPNPFSPLFSDTVYAFLTVGQTASNRRYQVETDVNFSGWSAASYFYKARTFNADNANYNTVQEYADETSDPRYTQAEGWGRPFPKGSSTGTNFSALNVYITTPLPAFFSVNYSGMSNYNNANADHEIATYYTDQNGNFITLADSVFKGFLPVRQTFTISNLTIGSSSNLFLSSVSSSSFSAFSNNTMLHYAQMVYPHTLDMNGAALEVMYPENSGPGKSTYYFTNFNAGGGVVFYDLTNGKKINVVSTASQVSVVIPGSPGRKKCIIASVTEIIPVTALKMAGSGGYFTQIKNTGNPPYLIISSRTFQLGAASYAGYRQSQAGGGYNVLTAYAEDLYEQFGYGINKHPVAIRNFIRYLSDSILFRPAYCFLIGKGIRNTLNAPGDPVNFIPVMGYPPSDNLLMSAISGTNSFAPEVPVGRLAAINNGEVLTYLQKVQEHETAPPADWKKRVLHFVGGDDEVLMNTLSAYMSSFAQVISDTLFGGEVYTFKKTTTAPIQVNISDSIRSMISNGAALINIFGHGSFDGFDQAIDDPEKYDNTGRYPFVIANSCYSGDIHDNTRRSVSERFVFAKERGSVGFMATTSLGFDYALANYTGKFYKALSATKYNQGIGEIAREASLLSSQSIDIYNNFVGLDMTLHGDPAVRISNGPLPDYRIFNNDLRFDLRTHSDSVGLAIGMKNLGAAVNDSILVNIERYFPGGDSSVITRTLRAPYFRDSLKLYIPVDFQRGIGLNNFRVTLDQMNRVTESDESNNSTGLVSLFIPGGDIVPVYPYRYAIVPNTGTIVLKASTSDPFAPQTSYRLQLDTCDLFINPVQSTVITSSGGVIEWKVNLQLPDSTVYYWRVSRDSTGPQKGFVWRGSSFQVIQGTSGWGQSHFHQFRNNSYQFVKFNRSLRKFTFENTVQSIECKNGIEPYVTNDLIAYYFNTIRMNYWSCAWPGWNFAVFDSISGLPQKVKSLNYPSAGFGQYNNYICVDNTVMNLYSFGSKKTGDPSQPLPNWKTDMENFLNSVAPNNYVLAYTIDSKSDADNPGISTYSNSLYNAFESIGAKTIRTTSDTVPYILFGRKGMTAGQGHEIKGTSRKSVITLKDSILTRWNNGYIASELIGPSYQWNSLHWRVQKLENGPGDTTVLKLVGFRKSGQADTLVTFKEDSSDVTGLHKYINADVYPYLKLVAFMKDYQFSTSPQLKKWQVLYEEAPECAINPLKGFSSVNDTLQEGDQVIFRFPIENIGVKDFKDSLVITYWIEDNQRNTTTLPSSMKARPFRAGQVITDTLKVNSYQLKGSNAVWIYVNPSSHARYQKEQAQFNNIARYPFRVNTDVTNPLLDVTFDGVRILNGDIVSARPEILITLKDENKFLALNDTSAFNVSILQPGQTIPLKLTFARDLRFTPASLPRNSASILYNPRFNQDGRYTLIVQARDRSRNASGAQDYRVQFEVSNKPTVTSVLNYPNPFSTATHFVFTLTGSEIPEVFTIQIMTVTGKVVREITRSELGNLHIGRNITDYAWDGRDNYGDRLGNGIYLYRVITKLNGEDVEKHTSGADQYFVKELGKMVIMR